MSAFCILCLNIWHYCHLSNVSKNKNFSPRYTKSYGEDTGQDYFKLSHLKNLPDGSADIEDDAELCPAGDANDGRSVEVDQLRSLVHRGAAAAHGLAGFVVAASQDFAFVWWKSKKSQEELNIFILLQEAQLNRMLSVAYSNQISHALLTTCYSRLIRLISLAQSDHIKRHLLCNILTLNIAINIASI